MGFRVLVAAAAVLGGNASLHIEGWFLDAANRVSFFETAGSRLDGMQVEALPTAMAALAPPFPGQLELTHDQREGIDPILAANWHSTS